jgi:hypothetical protein
LNNTDPATNVPNDRPLPPYTVSYASLTPTALDSGTSTLRQGVDKHAAYVIEMPPKWNGDLVVWAHGYRGQDTILTAEPPAYGLRRRLLAQGYAWAASSYTANGFDIRSGVQSSKELADLFRHLHGRPHRTYLAGTAMGGYVIGRSLEQYPGFYDGALPLCGVLGDQTLFDFYADYNLVAQTLAGIPAYPVPVDYLTAAVPQIQARLGLSGLTPTGRDTTNALGAQLRSITINATGGPRPGAASAFAVWKDALFAFATPTRDPAPRTPRRRTRLCSPPTCSRSTHRTRRSTWTAPSCASSRRT